MVTMTPEELARYLDILISRNVTRADVSVSGARFVVEFAPVFPVETLPGDEPTPGGWKAPERLDNPADLWPRDPGPQHEE